MINNIYYIYILNMFNKHLIIILIYFTNFNIAYIYNNIYSFEKSYNNHNLKLRTTFICDVCKLKIDTKYYIPENCTLPIGCPFNIKTNNTKKYIFNG